MTLMGVNTPSLLFSGLSGKQIFLKFDPIKNPSNHEKSIKIYAFPSRCLKNGPTMGARRTPWE
jgi:hypothetical protein